MPAAPPTAASSTKTITMILFMCASLKRPDDCLLVAIRSLSVPAVGAFGQSFYLGRGRGIDDHGFGGNICGQMTSPIGRYRGSAGLIIDFVNQVGSFVQQ